MGQLVKSLLGLPDDLRASPEPLGKGRTDSQKLSSDLCIHTQ